MNWHILIFSLIGFFSSLIIFIDHSITNMCFTRGCNIIRKNPHEKILGWGMIFFGFFAFLIILFLLIWFPENVYIGIISSLGTIFSIYFLFYTIKYHQEQCPLCILSNISMFFVFLLWFSALF